MERGKQNHPKKRWSRPDTHRPITHPYDHTHRTTRGISHQSFAEGNVPKFFSNILVLIVAGSHENIIVIALEV